MEHRCRYDDTDVPSVRSWPTRSRSSYPENHRAGAGEVLW